MWEEVSYITISSSHGITTPESILQSCLSPSFSIRRSLHCVHPPSIDRLRCASSFLILSQSRSLFILPNGIFFCINGVTVTPWRRCMTLGALVLSYFAMKSSVFILTRSTLYWWSVSDTSRHNLSHSTFASNSLQSCEIILLR